MPDFHLKNNGIAKEAVSTFLGKLSQGSKQREQFSFAELVSKIFEGAGKKNSLAMVRLRKLWVERLDEFLVRHAFPRNFTINSRFIANETFESQIAKSLSDTKIQAVAASLNQSVFNSPSELIHSFQKRLNEPLSEEERKLILQHASFQPYETVLHLTVYDGALSQAIKFEETSYLKSIQALVPNFKINRLQCHVGNLDQSRQDQVVLGALAKRWDRIQGHSPNGTPWNESASPAFIHRPAPHKGVLFVYVSDKEFAKLCNAPEWAASLLESVYETIGGTKSQFQSLRFVANRGMKPFANASKLIMMGESAAKYTPSSKETSVAQANALEFPKREDQSPQEAVQAIIGRMRQKTKR